MRASAQRNRLLAPSFAFLAHLSVFPPDGATRYRLADTFYVFIPDDSVYQLRLWAS